MSNNIQNANNNFSYLGQNTHNSGFTNMFLTSRHNDQLFTERYKDYKMFEEDGCTNTTGNDIVKGIHEKNPLTRAFFSKKNLDHLQNLIIKMVYEHSDCQYKISRQSDNELFTVMRSLYLQYGKNLPYDIPGQVAELNKQVLLDVVPRIITKVEQHLHYQRDAGSMPRPMPRGELASMAGTKTTRGFSSLFI